MSVVEPELDMPELLLLVLLPVVPFDMLLLVLPLLLVPVVSVVPVVLHPNSARLRVSTAMRLRTALCVRFIVVSS
jgi:hypothetical protein